MKYFLLPAIYDEWEKIMGTEFMRTYCVRVSLVVGCK
jgi:hypothetical protein